MVPMRLHALSIGTAQDHPYLKTTVSSAIAKRQIHQSLQLTPTGLAGDQQVDTRHHGGPDRAICVYPLEHYAHWNGLLERELELPAFGENFTTVGLLETEVCIGDVYQIGEVQVQVTQPRQPCFKLAMRHGVKDFPVLIVDAGFTGFYLRVLKTGEVRAGFFPSHSSAKERCPSHRPTRGCMVT